MPKIKINGSGEWIGKVNMFNVYYLYSFASFLIGFFKKLLFINQYTAGPGFQMFSTGGFIGHKKQIQLGIGVKLYGWLISDGGKIIIGDHTIIHPGAIIRAKKSIIIGDYSCIGANCYVQDHNSMSLNHLERRKKIGTIDTKPIIIGNDVWIGRTVTILKGIRIGDRAIIGARAVVVHDVPPDSTVVGNPARVVKYNLSEQ